MAGLDVFFQPLPHETDDVDESANQGAFVVIKRDRRIDHHHEPLADRYQQEVGIVAGVIAGDAFAQQLLQIQR